MKIILDSQAKANELFAYLGERFCVNEFNLPCYGEKTGCGYGENCDVSCQRCFKEALKDKIEIQKS